MARPKILNKASMQATIYESANEARQADVDIESNIIATSKKKLNAYTKWFSWNKNKSWVSRVIDIE